MIAALTTDPRFGRGSMSESLARSDRGGSLLEPAAGLAVEVRADLFGDAGVVRVEPIAFRRVEQFDGNEPAVDGRKG